MPWMLRRHAPQHDVNAASRHLESFDYAQHDKRTAVVILSEAKDLYIPLCTFIS